MVKLAQMKAMPSGGEVLYVDENREKQTPIGSSRTKLVAQRYHKTKTRLDKIREKHT